MGNFVETMGNLPIMKFVSTTVEISTENPASQEKQFCFTMVLDNCDFLGANDFLDPEWEGWMCGTILRILQKRFFFIWCRPCQYRSKIPPSPISTVIERYKTFCKLLHWTMRICNSFSNFTFQLEFCKRQRYTLELICFIKF